MSTSLDKLFDQFLRIQAALVEIEKAPAGKAAVMVRDLACRARSALARRRAAGLGDLDGEAES